MMVAAGVGVDLFSGAGKLQAVAKAAIAANRNHTARPIPMCGSTISQREGGLIHAYVMLSAPRHSL